MPLARDIDALYRLPLAEFTAARNALAKGLSGEESKAVKALAKPTLLPWTVNQLYWGARPVYQRLLERGGRLRAAQIATLTATRGTSDGAKRAADEHRGALAEALGRALQFAAEAGERPPADELGRLLEAVSLMAPHPETPGRLTKVVQPAGFEALAGVTPVGASTSVTVARPSGVQRVFGPVGRPQRVQSVTGPDARRSEGRGRAADRAEARVAIKAQRARQAALGQALRALDRAVKAEARSKVALDRAYDAHERAKDVRRAAERTLRDLRS